MGSQLAGNGNRAGAGRWAVVLSVAFYTASAHAQDFSGLPAQFLEKVEAAQQACSVSGVSAHGTDWGD